MATKDDDHDRLIKLETELAVTLNGIGRSLDQLRTEFKEHMAHEENLFADLEKRTADLEKQTARAETGVKLLGIGWTIIIAVGGAAIAVGKWVEKITHANGVGP